MALLQVIHLLYLSQMSFHPWPSGLVIPEKLLAVKQGNSSQIEIEVTHTTKHDILLPNQTVLGRIELVQSVTPVEVKFKEWPKAQTEHKLESEPTESKPQVTTSEPPPHIKDIDLGDLQRSSVNWPLIC